MGRETASNSRVAGDLHARLGGVWKWPEGPCDEGIWLEVPILHSDCQRLGDLEGFGAGKE